MVAYAESSTKPTWKRAELQVIAPARFVEEAAAESVLAGPTMVRRGSYQFGSALPKGPEGHVDARRKPKPRLRTRRMRCITSIRSGAPAVWGKARVLDYLSIQRDLYKYVHDQNVAVDEP